MIGNRRDFLKAAAATSVLGASDALAQTDIPWIMFLHSTRLEDAWQEAFLQGLRDQGWEGDPSLQPTQKDVVIKAFYAGSKYTRTGGNLKKAVTNTINQLGPKLKLIVTGGGMVAGLAAGGITVPCLLLMGRNNDFGAQRVGGYYFDVISGNTNVNLNDKISYLNNSATYNIQYKDMCLLYNSNSWMGPLEKDEWVRQLGNLGVANPYFVDVADFTDDGSKTNVRIRVNKAINKAVGAPMRAQAIVVSGDPHLTTKRARIVSHAGKLPVKMCYPFQEYDEETSENGLGTSAYMIYGPKLETVYRGLGRLAGQVLTNPSTGLSLVPLDPNDLANPYYKGL